MSGKAFAAFHRYKLYSEARVALAKAEERWTAKYRELSKGEEMQEYMELCTEYDARNDGYPDNGGEMISVYADYDDTEIQMTRYLGGEEGT